MELRLILLIKIVIETILIAAIVSRAKDIKILEWSRAIMFIVAIGVILSALNSFTIIFYSDSTILSWSTFSQLIRGELITVIWEIISIFSFLYFTKTSSSRLSKILNNIITEKGVLLIGVYSFLALLLSMILRFWLFKEGFAGFLYESTRPTSGLRQFFFELPARIWYYPLGILAIRAINFKNTVKRTVFILSVVAIFIAVMLSFWTLGFRGMILPPLVFLFAISLYLRSTKKVLILLVPVIILAIIFMIPTAEYRSSKNIHLKSLAQRAKELYEMQREEKFIKSFMKGIEYTIYRTSPAEPGIFAEWVEKNDAYAGITPIIGSLAGLVPRSIWPNKPAAGSIGPDYDDNPAYMTGKIMGTPNVSRNTSPATNSFWVGWYPSLIVFALIAGWFAAIIVKVGKINIELGFLLLAITLAWGRHFLLVEFDRILLMFTQAILPIMVFLAIFKAFFDKDKHKKCMIVK